MGVITDSIITLCRSGAKHAEEVFSEQDIWLTICNLVKNFFNSLKAALHEKGHTLTSAAIWGSCIIAAGAAACFGIWYIVYGRYQET